jgi:excinuclease UvrABC nuclease subunit
MVVFDRGVPQKSAYKRFKIRGKGSQGEPDDYASMREMLRRRFRRIVEPEPEPGPGKGGRAQTKRENEAWRILPDLVIVDGGKGQLGIAVEVLEEFNLLERIPVVGLAKQEEEFFRPNQSGSIWLKRGGQALFLVQRIRDEAHRFAITYHRNLRRKEQTRSALDDVKGIGPARRRALLTYFGRACAEEGQPERGLAAVNAALAASAVSGEHWVDAETWRTKADLLARRQAGPLHGERSRRAVDACLRAAIRIAGAQGATALAWRAEEAARRHRPT